MTNKNVKLHVSSESFRRPSRSGYGCVLLDGESRRVLVGAGDRLSSLYMSVSGVVAGLHAVKSQHSVTLYLSRKDLTNWINGGITFRWEEEGWDNKTARKYEQLWWRLNRQLEKRSVAASYCEGRLNRWARRIAICKMIDYPFKHLKPEAKIEKEGRISDRKRAAFWAAARNSGYSDAGVRKLLWDHGVVSSKDITEPEFDSIMTKAESKTIQTMYDEVV